MTSLIEPKKLPPPISTPARRTSRTAAMKDVATIILSGGQGSRLFPLTKHVSKPGLCYGGRHCLIDIPIANTLHSGCSQIFVITQFLASSLHQHIFNTYRTTSSFSSGIELLTAEERPQHKTWFQGTADAVRQNLDRFNNTCADYFLILSGDQLYNMNFADMLHFAQESDADLVIATLPIDEQHAKRMGVMQIDHNHRITSFKEKPQEKQQLDEMRLHNPLHPSLDFLGSMGIYLFKRQALIDLLQQDPREDFGKHLIPTKVNEGQAAAYIYQGYWEDIGTVESFYSANLNLATPSPAFDCHWEDRLIFTNPTHLPGAKFFDTNIKSSIICEGSVIKADAVTGSILGPRTVIDQGSVICDTYVMGNDAYFPRPKSPHASRPFQIGKNCMIKKTIIDKHASIGDHVQLVNHQQVDHLDHEFLYIRDGIIIVPRGAHIPDGFIL